MPPSSATAPPSSSQPRKGPIASLRLALSFLTILPIAPSGSGDPAEVAVSFGYFPLAGLLIGLFLVGEDILLGMQLELELRSILIVLSMTILTGALHLDALSDTADALGARGDHARALEIMRDSNVGSYGVIAIFFDLVLKSLSLGTISSNSMRAAALILAPTLARFSMVAVGHGLDYLRPSGAGSFFLGDPVGSRRNLATASILTFGGCLIVAFLQLELTLIALAISIATIASFRAIYRRWMGGVTGDMIGAAGEIVEIAVFLIFAAAAGRLTVSV